VTTLAERLAAFAVAVRDEIPQIVVDDVAGRLVDTFGNALAARSLHGEHEPHHALERLVRQQGGVAEASIWGGGPERVPASSAALVNGTLAHALDFDDTHLPSVLHPSASVIPAAFAVGEARDASGRELAAAIAVGIEITNRLGMVGYSRELRNSVFFEHGLHATSICGTIGAAAAAAMLSGADETVIVSALGIAASMGAGIIEANRTGGTVKRIHCGWAAHAGIEAARFAGAGVTGPPTVFEGRFGFFTGYLREDADADALTDGLGERWELLRTVFKPYPANHFTHPVIDCGIELRRQGLDPDRVRSAIIGVAAATLRTIGEPREEKVRPRSGYHAKFSGPYLLASALLGGGGLGVGLADFTDAAVHDPRRLELAARVRLVADPICDEEFPNAFSAVVTVVDEDERTWEVRRHSSLGSPEHPLSPEGFGVKFAENLGSLDDELDADVVLGWLRELPTMPRVALPDALTASALR
jgi:2-methylcitrate dehydratase PrpD